MTPLVTKGVICKDIYVLPIGALNGLNLVYMPNTKKEMCWQAGYTDNVYKLSRRSL